MSRRSQYKPTTLVVCNGDESFDTTPELWSKLAETSRAKIGAKIVAHKKWTHGAWLLIEDDENSGFFQTPRFGDVWKVKLIIGQGGMLLIACPVTLIKSAKEK